MSYIIFIYKRDLYESENQLYTASPSCKQSLIIEYEFQKEVIRLINMFEIFLSCFTDLISSSISHVFHFEKKVLLQSE